MDSWGRGKKRFFGGKSHGATSRNYIAQLVLKKKFKSNLAKIFFDRAFITFYYNLRKLLCQQRTAERACRRQVLSREQEKVNGREQESARVEQAKTIAKESALEVEEEDKILAKKVGK